MLRLPDDLRSAFKEPLGPVYTDASALLSVAGDPLVAVGDVVTYHLLLADRAPDVAVVDGLTEREVVDDEVAAVVEREWVANAARRVDVENPAATLTADLLVALREAIDAAASSAVVVDGEEDLATLAAVVAAPNGASVVYGQPGEGMVHVPVTPESRDTCRDLLSRMDGDAERALSLLTD
jgi:hypothetical protein